MLHAPYKIFLYFRMYRVGFLVFIRVNAHLRSLFHPFAAGTNGGIQPMKIYRDNGTVDQAQTAWNVVNAIGAILFAYSFSFILLEIQDTIATRRGTKWNPVSTMKISVNVAVGIMTAFYIVSVQTLSWKQRTH